jgi:aspartate/methionine/tyrosine aminotransferase
MNISSWNGRFPRNGIISLLDVHRTHNLAESTSLNLTFGDLLDLGDLQKLRTLSLGYGSAHGSLKLREVIGAACGTSPDNVLTTQGAALALFLLAFEVCNRGADVVLATPCFPPSRDTLLACGAHIHAVPLNFDDGYRLDVAQISSRLTQTTRLVSIASPQNPSGVRVSEGEIRELLRQMQDRSPQALLFVDETYREAAYGDEPVPASMAGLDARLVTGASVSKALGAPGLRVGWLTVPDAALRERLTVAKMNLTVSGSPLDEALATLLIEHRETILAPRRRMLALALETTRSWLHKESRRVEWVAPQAGALCCMRLRRNVFDAAAISHFWRSLERHDLQLAPGDWFGEEACVFRLGFGFLPIDRLPFALEAVTRALNYVTP